MAALLTLIFLKILREERVIGKGLVDYFPTAMCIGGRASERAISFADFVGRERVVRFVLASVSGRDEQAQLAENWEVEEASVPAWDQASKPVHAASNATFSEISLAEDWEK